MVNTNCKKLLNEINPIGGIEKANAVNDVVQKLDINFSDVVYVGDSITDMDALRMVKKNGGLSISFNGNNYAIRESEIAVISTDAVIISIIVNYFNKFGKEYLVNKIEAFDFEIKDLFIDSILNNKFEETNPTPMPIVKIINDSERDQIIRDSLFMRKKIRGESIGGLG